MLYIITITNIYLELRLSFRNVVWLFSEHIGLTSRLTSVSHIGFTLKYAYMVASA